MQGEEKKNRISRIKLRNIASPNHFKPVTERDYLFGKVKKNSAVLSRKVDNSEDNIRAVNQSDVFQMYSYESMAELIAKKQSVNEVRNSRRYSSASHSVNSSNSFIKRAPQILLPQVRKVKELSLSTSQSNKAFDDSQNSSKNHIQGTQIGVLSTKQIIKKYEVKKLTEQMSKKKFLDQYIQNLKPGGGFQIDEEPDDHHLVQNLNDLKSFAAQNSQSTVLAKSQTSKEKDKNLSQKHEKLVNLLENRLTDRDYIDLNVKLFQKRDINKKKFFQRYHNILKQQRKQIANK